MSPELVGRFFTTSATWQVHTHTHKTIILLYIWNDTVLPINYISNTHTHTHKVGLLPSATLTSLMCTTLYLKEGHKVHILGETNQARWHWNILLSESCMSLKISSHVNRTRQPTSFWSIHNNMIFYYCHWTSWIWERPWDDDNPKRKVPNSRSTKKVAEIHKNDDCNRIHLSFLF